MYKLLVCQQYLHVLKSVFILFVTDPFDLGHNLGGGLSRKSKCSSGIHYKKTQLRIKFQIFIVLSLDKSVCMKLYIVYVFSESLHSVYIGAC